MFWVNNINILELTSACLAYEDVSAHGGISVLHEEKNMINSTRNMIPEAWILRACTYESWMKIKFDRESFELNHMAVEIIYIACHLGYSSITRRLYADSAVYLTTHWNNIDRYDAWPLSVNLSTVIWVCLLCTKIEFHHGFRADLYRMYIYKDLDQVRWISPLTTTVMLTHMILLRRYDSCLWFASKCCNTSFLTILRVE